MDNSHKTTITVEAKINAAVETIWSCWTKPEHISQWYFAADTWHCPHATNDLEVGGRFLTRMEAKDGSFGFDFGGVYTDIRPHQFIAYTMGDGRTAQITFTSHGVETTVTQTFDAETENPIDLQQAGWQAILDNFKKYVEAT